jgi:release factor glutamine methyltransferase
VAGLLEAARRVLPLSEARLLLQHVLDCSHAQLAAYPRRQVAAEHYQRFGALIRRRAAGEPVAYLIGSREFYGRSFAVSPAVLIPRPETELLIDLARHIMRGRPRPRVLDLGTGSGVIAITLAKELPNASVAATDVSAAALALAADNAHRLDARVRFVRGDWFAALGAERFDLIVANPPYVAAGDAHLLQGDLRFEPQTALVGGADGLDAVREIVNRAPAHLVPGGWLLSEHGYDQADACRALLSGRGFADVASWSDLAGIPRVSGGQLDGPSIRSVES